MFTLNERCGKLRSVCGKIRIVNFSLTPNTDSDEKIIQNHLLGRLADRSRGPAFIVNLYLSPRSGNTQHSSDLLLPIEFQDNKPRIERKP